MRCHFLFTIYISDITYGSYDTTLVTMFTVDRFSKFETLVQLWGAGPVITVIYATETQAEMISTLMRSSSVISNHHDVVCHLVYKTGVCSFC